MEFPKNGSVVIVDDQIKDVEELMVALSKQNVPTYYFSGKHKYLHRELNNIKVIFLDINFEHGTASNTTTTVDNLVNIVAKLINENANDYIIVTWSTVTQSYDHLLKERLQKAYENKEKYTNHPEMMVHRLPKHIFSINKSDMKTGGGDFDLNKINSAINDLMPQNDIMKLTTHWENNVLESAKNVLNNFSNIANNDNEHKEIYALFADAISKTESLSKDNIINPALAPLSALLADQIASSVNNGLLQGVGQELVVALQKIKRQKDKILSIDKVSKINKFYHIDTGISCNTFPGTVYDYRKMEVPKKNNVKDKKRFTKYVLNRFPSSYKKEALRRILLTETTPQWAEGLRKKVLEKFKFSNPDEYLKGEFMDHCECLLHDYKNISEIHKELKNASSFEELGDSIDPKVLQQLIDLIDNFETLNGSQKVSELKGQASSKKTQINEEIIEKQLTFVFGKSTLGTDEYNQLDSKCKKGQYINQQQHDQKMNAIQGVYIQNEKEKYEKSFDTESIPIFLEFSPDCDFVQNKRKKLRLIFGLMYPYSPVVEMGKEDKDFDGDNFIYTPIIEFNQKAYKVVLDLQTVTGINEETLNSKELDTLFRFRKELLVDIQQKIASHIARPGFFNMNDYLK